MRDLRELKNKLNSSIAAEKGHSWKFRLKSKKGLKNKLP